MKKLVLMLLVAIMGLTGCRGTEPETESDTTEPVEPKVTVTDAQTAAQWLNSAKHYTFNVGNEHLVTVERTEEDLLLTVWDDASKQIQTIHATEVEDYDALTASRAMASNSGWWETVQDFNFDGYMDFGYRYRSGAQPTYYHVFLWDADGGRYVWDPAFDELSCPVADAVEEKITSYQRGGAAGAIGDYSIHRWLGGKLTEVRHIHLGYLDEANSSGHVITVSDLTDSGMSEVFRYEGEDWSENTYKPWLELSYVG